MRTVGPGKRQRTRIQILQTAGLLFARDGFDAVTMDQLAAEAGIARGTLYNHFPIKEAVLAEWMHARLAQDLGPLKEEVMTRQSFAARIATVLAASASWWESNRAYAAPYIRYRFQSVADGAGTQTASDLVDVYAQLIEAAQRSGEVRADEPAARMAQYLHFLYFSALLAWLGDGTGGASLETAFGDAFEFFLRGAAPR